MIKVGDSLPAATLMEYVEVEGNGCSIGPNPVDVAKATAGKTIALFALPGSLLTVIALVMVAAVVALVAWALQLMQAASDRQEFSLMLAGCMVCSAAVGLATVMVLTITSPGRLEAAHGVMVLGSDRDSGISLDAIVLPWDDNPALAQAPSFETR